MSSIKSSGGEAEVPNFLFGLPRELIAQELSQWLKPIDICHIGSTCHELRWLLYDKSIWARFVISTFSADWQKSLSQEDQSEIKPDDVGYYRKIFEILYLPPNYIVRSELPNGSDRHIIKTIVLGASGAGKTSMTNRFCRRIWQTYPRCIGAEFFVSYATVADSSKMPPWAPTDVVLQIWDTAGQERFNAIGKYYYRDALAAALVFDITNRSSFDDIERWVSELMEQSGSKCQFVLVGAKLDLASKCRKVSRTEARRLAAKIGCRYIECSSKEDINVDHVYGYLATRVLQRWPQPVQTTLVAPMPEDPPNQKSIWERSKNWIRSFWQ